MLASLVAIVRDLGVQALAEGIETEEEAEVCRQMGFDSAQGYFFGRLHRQESTLTWRVFRSLKQTAKRNLPKRRVPFAWRRARSI